MKKMFFTILLSLMAPFVVLGQTLHAIIFANTQNDDIGQSVTVDFKRMGLEVTTIAKSIGYTLKKYYYYGEQTKFNHHNLDKVLTDLSCTPDDIVFFYYSGHGLRAENEKTDFPEMCLYVNEEDFFTNTQFYPLHDVYSRIINKQPRLTIVMGDLCNSLIEGYYRNEGNSSKGATILSKGTCNVYKNLFLNAKGGLIVTSSEPEYPSRCYIFSKNGNWYHAGGYLTHSFLQTLQSFVSQNEDVNWQSLMNNTIVLTKELSKTDVNGNPVRPQVPIYKSDIVPILSPLSETNIIAPPQAPLASNDEEITLQDNLAYSLSMICNQSISKLDRIRNIPKAKNYFENTQIRVQVVGFDNRTIVNTCGIGEYLNYLSIATKMDQVVVLETQKNDTGKIIYMKVHEIHYQ